MKTIMRTIAIMATMWCVVSINVHGQTYQESFKQMLLKGVTSDPREEFSKFLTGLPGEEPNSPLVQKYIKEQLLDDIIDFMSSYYEPYLTIEDIHAICNSYDTPDVKIAMAHLKELTDNTNGGIISQIHTTIQQIFSGQSVSTVVLNEGISEEYLSLCSKYCSDENSLSNFEVLLDKLESLVNESEKCRISDIKKYLNNNINVIYANACYGKVTDKDFCAISNLYNSPAFSRYRECTKAWVMDADKLGHVIKEKWNEYKAANNK